MEYFDFHHHSPEKYGIYNLNIGEDPANRPFSAGILPQQIYNGEAQEFLLKTTAAAQDKNCIAIGECGLDSRAEADDAAQEKLFLKQIEIAEDAGKPVIVHCVRKFPQLLAIKKKSNARMVLHGFNKKKDYADMLLNAGFYLSFGTALLQSVPLQKIFTETPPDRFFLETDADETADISQLYGLAASLKGTTAEKVQETIWENLENFKK